MAEMTRADVLEILACTDSGCSRCYDPDEPDHECCMVPSFKEALAVVEAAGWRLVAPAAASLSESDEEECR